MIIINYLNSHADRSCTESCIPRHIKSVSYIMTCCKPYQRSIARGMYVVCVVSSVVTPPEFVRDMRDRHTHTHTRYQPCVFTAPGMVTQYVVALQHLRDNGDTYDQFVTLVRATCCVDPHRSFKHVWFLREFNQHDISLTKKVVWQYGICGTHGMYKFVVPKPVFRDNLPSNIGLASPYHALRIINQHILRVVISNYSSKCFGATGATFEFQDIKAQMFVDV